MPEGLLPGSTEKSPARELVIRLIAQNGPMTFASFMETALYSPDAGYYASGHNAWGPGGDYITSLDVSPVFARALAREVEECWCLLGRPKSFELIEAGAGRGWLSSTILDYAEESCPALYDAMTARCVERSGGPAGAGREKVFWHRGLDELEPVETAVVLSNELIDSLPVHRVLFAGGELKELFVDFDGKSFLERPGPLSTDALSKYFERAGVELFEGMITEVNLSSGRWVRQASALFSRGFMATIDYGAPARELYSSERGSSLHCHFRHRLNDNPFVNVGEQDITAHVDFTSFAIDSIEAGLSLTGFTTQKNFLLGLGVLEELRTPASLGVEGTEDVNFNRAIGQLISPGGMGDIFKVIVAHKGVERPRLRGFSFKDMTRSLCLS